MKETYYEHYDYYDSSPEIIRFNVTKYRKLDDYERYCIGLSNDGFDNLTIVAKEITKRKDADEVIIDCKIKSTKVMSGDKLTINIMILFSLY